MGALTEKEINDAIKMKSNAILRKVGSKAEEKEAVIALLEEEMHQVAQLSVPLEVGTAWGENWYDAH